jgi:hypothetical protein
MFGPSGFFCFTHQLKTQNGEGQRYAFAYKPPGRLQRGALDELMLAMCKGPLLPDAVVIVGVKDEPNIDMLAELRAEGSVISRQRLQSRMASVKDMHDWGIHIQKCRKISEEDFQKLVIQNCKPQVGDVLIAKDGTRIMQTWAPLPASGPAIS